jgi:hypothetical protein
MTATSPWPALMLFELLASPKGQPQAVQLHLSSGEPSGALAAVHTEAFKQLVGRWPAHLDAQVLAASAGPVAAASVAQAWTAAGVAPLSPGWVHHADSLATALPKGTRFVTGRWAEAAPPKPNAAQAAARALALQLLQMVNGDAEVREIEDLLRRDAGLTYQLLRLVNSAAFAGGREVSSIAQAVMLIGRQQLKRWVHLVVFVSGPADVRAPMLLARAAWRGRTLEQLMQAAGRDRSVQDQAFMVGMLSWLGVLFGMPLSDVLKPLALPAPVAQAVTQGTGELGHALSLARALEQFELHDAHTYAQALELSGATVQQAALDALAWVPGALPGP